MRLLIGTILQRSLLTGRSTTGPTLRRFSRLRSAQFHVWWSDRFLVTLLGVGQQRAVVAHHFNSYNPHLGFISVPPPCFVLPKNDLFHDSFTIKKARNRLNVGQILFTIHVLSKRPGRGAWDFINGGGLLIRGGD